MKTTLGLQDESPARAKRYAKKTGCPLRKVVEDGLREVLAVRLPRRRYRLPDSSVGNADAADPLEARSWPDLRGMIYGEREHGDRGWHEPAGPCAPEGITHAQAGARACPCVRRGGGGVGDALAVLL